MHLLQLKKSKWQKFSNHFYLGLCSYSIISCGYLLWNPKLSHFYFILGWAILAICLKVFIGEIRERFNKNNRRGFEVWPLNKISANRIIKTSGTIAMIGPFVLFFGFSVLTSGVINLLSSIFNIRPFNIKVRNRLCEIYHNRFSVNLKNNYDLDASVFWLPYATIHESCPTTASSLHTVRTIYYFSRNLCMTFMLGFFISTIASLVDGQVTALFIYGNICITLSFLFFVHYYNIYYNHYTKQTFRAFIAYIMNEPHTEKKSNIIQIV